MFGCEVLDVFDEFGSVDDFDVIGKADDETANATIVGDEGVKEPMRSIDFKDLILGKWVLLDEEAVGHDTQAKTDAEAVVACHAEDIDKAFAMRVAILPWHGQHLSVGDAGSLEWLIVDFRICVTFVAKKM